MKNELIYTCTAQQLTVLKSWLYREFQLHKKGFYPNWETILLYQKRNQLFCMMDDLSPIGFICWFPDGKLVRMDLVEVAPGSRNQGIGSEMVMKALQRFNAMGFHEVTIKCFPPESELFWCKMGFIRFSEQRQGSNIKMFKKLNKNTTLQP
jgi:GNAT superfamily N-acetyltransferase